MSTNQKIFIFVFLLLAILWLSGVFKSDETLRNEYEGKGYELYVKFKDEANRYLRSGEEERLEKAQGYLKDAIHNWSEAASHSKDTVFIKKMQVWIDLCWDDAYNTDEPLKHYRTNRAINKMLRERSQ